MEKLKEKWKKSDKRFLDYNKRNILINLLQAEAHAQAMQTISFIKGEGSCFLKHLAFVLGEVKEAINHSANVEPENMKTFEKLSKEIEEFFDKVESGKHNYHKRDLLNLVRKWRKEVEQTMPMYKTFYCKCFHGIPYLKILIIFLFGIIFGYFIFKLFLFLGI
jgi:glycyl-tRNA synthetase beta subunit